MVSAATPRQANGLSTAVGTSDSTPVRRDSGAEAEQARSTRSRQRWSFGRLGGLASVVGGLALWQLVAVLGWVDPLILPKFSDVISKLWSDLSAGELNEDIVATALPFAVGLVISIIAGALIGVLMGLSRVVDKILSPWVFALNSVPRIAFVPMLVVAFGLGFQMHLVVIISTATIPMIIPMHAGVRAVDVDLLEMGRAFRASRLVAIRRIVLPYSSPFFVSGFRVALGHALVGEIVAEFFASNAGLGFRLNTASQLYDITTAYGMIILLAIIGVALAQLARIVENRMKRWHG
jgi:ABC-type nitrate/sulfonate/bicarbonate transport system permease component